ncbi:unnamed protein product [Rotaria magnacalcarata]|uniref:Uncharacterized protein n=1 Tax=Rotaria magnacalcarata TaxID=392030 RepID=A0A816Z243_9BILA|nr:unnamed protein product [Rotaria magnacalcarata]CAF1389869.1 unnamed protein product [Rotaria magnacalcarata]CAF2180087.1 unnamed protein product [Rotaria magnacalcarata]CAF3794455.1 unnamed protein product [Rotaria magnacalcarata]CAF3811872.1 unnamed protein product [Rotaria magnacalcarata]
MRAKPVAGYVPSSNINACKTNSPSPAVEGFAVVDDEDVPSRGFFDVFTRSQTITTPKHIFISSATNTKDSTTCLVAPETHLSTSPSIAKTTSCVDVRQALTEYFLQNPL